MKPNPHIDLMDCPHCHFSLTTQLNASPISAITHFIVETVYRASMRNALESIPFLVNTASGKLQFCYFS